MRPPRVIAIAYACEPSEGSEPGAGWIHARMLAGIAETWVLTRTVPPDVGPNWPTALPAGDGYDAWLADLPEKGRLRFVHVDIPWWDRFWWTRPWRPKFSRLQRVEYVVWLWLALRAARRLMREREFDASWHLTWANAWLGSTLPLAGLPFVYGPVGGGVAPPWRLAASLGAGAFVAEIGREVLRTAFRHLNPLSQLAARRASLILAQNPETLAWLPRSGRGRTVVQPNAVVTAVPRRPAWTATAPYTALFAGRLIPWKGASLAVRTMAELPDWRLVIAGDGPEEPRLRRLVERLGLTNRVEFLGRIPRNDVVEIMRVRADLLLFPSLHDEAGFVVAEAVATGIPVVCLDRGGPPVLGGIGVRPGSLRQTVRDLASAVRSAPIGEPSPPTPTLEARRADLAELVRRFGIFEPLAVGEAIDSAATSDRVTTEPRTTALRSPVPGAARPLRVLHVVARLGLGGSERMAQILAEGLVSRNMATAVLPIGADNDTAMADNVRSQLEEHGIAVLPASRQQSVKRALAEAAFLVPRAAASFEPDVVHLHTEIPEFAWAVASLTSPRFGRVPVVRTIHNSRLWGGWPRFGSFAERRLDGAPTAAVSIAAAEGFAAWRHSIGRTERPVRIIYNGVPAAAADQPTIPSPRGPITLCFAGRFEAEKGVDILVDALEILESSGLSFEVAVHGTGRDEESIRARIHHLRRRIEIGPPIPDLRDRLASFSAMVMPSRFEGLPLLAIETICAGVPLLAADAPGLREAIPPDYPGAFPAENGAALAAKIADFVADPRPWHDVAPAAAAWARSRFSPERMVDGYVELYREALRDR